MGKLILDMGQDDSTDILDMGQRKPNKDLTTKKPISSDVLDETSTLETIGRVADFPGGLARTGIAGAIEGITGLDVARPGDAAKA